MAAQSAQPPPAIPATEVSRRRFFTKVALGVSGLIGAAIAVPFIGYLIGPLFDNTPEDWRDLGNVDRFEIGKTVFTSFQDPSPLPWSGETSNTGVWVRRNGRQDFTVFAINCAHLGCPVNWLGEARLFLCPCHGGVYYEDGSVAAGPPPRPLYQYQVRVQNGVVQALSAPLPTG